MLHLSAKRYKISYLMGRHPYERRFGKPFKGPIIPFDSLVEYYLKTAKDQSRIHQFGKNVLPGLFLGYALYAGGIWKGDVLVADLEELETMDASEIYSKRLNAKEVIFPKEIGEFIFPIADGRIKPLGGDQDLRTSTSIRQRPIQGESHVDFLGESEGSLSPPRDSFPDAGEAINDFWSMSGNFIHRHHVEPRVKLYSPREESLPIPMKYIDVSRTTHTNLDVKQEKRIDDYWNIDGSRDLSDPWTGFTRFILLEEKPPDAYMWSGVRLTRKQLTSRPDHLWPELWDNMAERMMLEFAESGHPIFRATSQLSRGRLKSKGHKKLSIHYCADLETIETIFRIIVSVNQLSLYGAVAEMCEEYETLHDRTGQPVVGGQSSSSFVPSVINTEVPLDCDDLAHKDLLLQQYGERIEKLSQQDKLSKFCMDAGFLNDVEIGQYFMMKDTAEFSQFRAVACREYTLPRDEEASQPKGWIQGNAKIGPVLEIATCWLHGKYGV